MIQRTTQKTSHAGFTIVEMIVSIGLFTMVLTVSVGSLLAIVEGYHKAQALSVASDSLKLIMEDMTRNIAQGRSYHCDKDASGSPNPPLTDPLSCDNRPSGEDHADSMVLQSNRNNQYITYWLQGDEVWKQDTDGTQDALSDSEIVRIDDLRFYVFAGENVGNDEHPRVIVALSGTVGTGTKATAFDVQTTIVQRTPKR